MLVANIYKEYTYLSQCEIFRYIRARYVIELDVFDKFIESICYSIEIKKFTVTWLFGKIEFLLKMHIALGWYVIHKGTIYTKKYFK